jgi:hypothetical protein
MCFQRSEKRAAEGGERCQFWRPTEIFDIENEGTTHDIIDNKGPNFLPHDVDDK